jgi:DNA-binding MarR family transcriptional regulator
VEAESILTSIRKIVRAIHLESKKVHKTYGVSIPQLLVLNYLHDQPHYKARMGDINKFLHLNPSTVTGIISRLELRGLVARMADTKDKRVNMAVLTAEGSKLLEARPQLLHDRLHERLRALPREKQNELSKAFEEVTLMLGIENLDASPLIILEDP